MTKEGISERELEDDYGGKKLYHLVYATRKGSAYFLEHLGQSDSSTISNIDYFHMQQAYGKLKQYVDEAAGVAKKTLMEMGVTE